MIRIIDAMHFLDSLLAQLNQLVATSYILLGAVSLGALGLLSNNHIEEVNHRILDSFHFISHLRHIRAFHYGIGGDPVVSRSVHIVHEAHVRELFFELLNFTPFQEKLELQVFSMARLVDTLVDQVSLDDVHGLQNLINEVLEKVIVVNVEQGLRILPFFGRC